MNYFRTRFSLGEISGAFGDAATFIPILVSLSQLGLTSVTASLVLSGLYNIVSGFYFDLPLPVQPMKSIAAIALVGSLTKEEIAGAGLFVSGVIALLALIGVLKIIHQRFPLYLIRGIQLGTGLTLAKRGVALVDKNANWNFSSWSDSYWISIAAMLIVWAGWHSRRTFSALILMLFGVIVASTKVQSMQVGMDWPVPFAISANEFGQGIWKAGIGQLPLTLANSVIAIAVLAGDLFPSFDVEKGMKSIALWVGAMNLIGAWFGAMPFCIGSGGLAAQYRFGARNGLSVIILGSLKLLLGLLFGKWIPNLFNLIPNSIIGVMLIVAGLQLSLVTIEFGQFDSKIRRDDGFLVLLVTAAGIFLYANDGIGIVIGIVSMQMLHWSACYNS
jgi:MFS superfamily sulfate permease-like transporter